MSHPIPPDAMTTNTSQDQELPAYTAVHLPPISTFSDTTTFPPEPPYTDNQHHHPLSLRTQHAVTMDDRPRYVPLPIPSQPMFSPPSRPPSSSPTVRRTGGVVPISELINNEGDVSPGRSASSVSGSAVTSPRSEYNGPWPGHPRANPESTSRSQPGYLDSTRLSATESLGRRPSPGGQPSFSGISSQSTSSIPLQRGLPGEGLTPSDRSRMRLKIIQQPNAARACGLGERDRRVIDPPPILQLYLENYDPNSSSDKNILRSPFNTVSCQLISAPNNNLQPRGQDVSRVSDPNDPSKDLRRLMGSLTISPFITENISPPSNIPEEGQIGSYYIFSDLSCRQNGRYKLRFTLLPIDATALAVGGRAETAATIESDEFMVYNAKDFPGMQQSSELTKKLKALGATVPIKKGNEGRAKKGIKKRTSDSDFSDND